MQNLCQWLFDDFSTAALIFCWLSCHFTLSLGLGRVNSRSPLDEPSEELGGRFGAIAASCADLDILFTKEKKQSLDVVRDNFLSDWDNLHYGDKKTLWKWYHRLGCIDDVSTLVIMVHLPQFSCCCCSTYNKLHWEHVINTFLRKTTTYHAVPYATVHSTPELRPAGNFFDSMRHSKARNKGTKHLALMRHWKRH